MRRYLRGLPMPQQLRYAREYRERFKGQVLLGDSPADDIEVVLPPRASMYPETQRALDELDWRVCWGE